MEKVVLYGGHVGGSCMLIEGLPCQPGKVHT